LIDGGYGKDKIIPQTLIVAGSIDVLMATIMFGICSTFALNAIGHTDDNPAMVAVEVIY